MNPWSIAKSINLSQIRSIEDLRKKEYTKAVLYNLVKRINREEGLVFCSTQFRKSPSTMRKGELIDAIWRYRSVILQYPGHGEGIVWGTHKPVGKRIIACCYGPTGEENLWTVNVGFRIKENFGISSEPAAKEVYKSLLKMNLCSMVMLRRGKRTGYKWELKIWGLSEKAYLKLIEKEQTRIRESANRLAACSTKQEIETLTLKWNDDFKRVVCSCLRAEDLNRVTSIMQGEQVAPPLSREESIPLLLERYNKMLSASTNEKLVKSIKKMLKDTPELVYDPATNRVKELAF